MNNKCGKMLHFEHTYSKVSSQQTFLCTSAISCGVVLPQKSCNPLNHCVIRSDALRGLQPWLLQCRTHRILKKIYSSQHIHMMIFFKFFFKKVCVFQVQFCHGVMVSWCQSELVSLFVTTAMPPTPHPPPSSYRLRPQIAQSNKSVTVHCTTFVPHC